MNRNWHSLNTKYNILYNGNLALDAGLKEIEESYKDNYWKILPVERLSISEKFSSDRENQNPNFERAEEKAVKAVQTHGMNIKGKEKNPQIDEAYILLGQSRYFSGRFIPALEAFNYILFKYPGSSNINLAKIWRAKTNLRLQNEVTALENLKDLIKKDNLSKNDLVEAQATLAQAYIHTKKMDSALIHLKKACSITKNKSFRGRLYFIEGQLYNKMGKKDSANMAFQKVIKLNRNVPKAYRVNAFLEQIRNFDYDSGDLEALSELLSDIEYNREHRPYLDRIYHMTAKHYLNLRSDSIAIVYFNKSLRTSSDDSYLNALSYHNIADLYFDKSSYSVAGTYYDSTLLNYKPNSRPYRAVKKRLDNLQDVIYYESIAKTNDSILNVVAMTKDEQKQYFNTIIEKIKADKEEEQAQQTTVVTSSSGFSTEKAKKAGTFYFYEPATVAFGKSEFANTWGNRPLVDNWRWSKKTISNSAQSDVTSEINKENTVGLLTAEYYINQTPKLQSEIDSIAKDRNFAYYQLGLIYKNKFKDYKRSKEKLEALLRQNPEDRLVLPSKYNLYKVYTLLLDKTLAASMKANIIQEYPTSRYAQILKNPAAILENDDQSPEAKYKVLFEKFEASKYQEVINSCEDEIIRFEGDEIVPKFELLKTSAKGRLYGFKDYKEGLNYIALNYPNSPEGKQSQDLIDNVLSSLEDDSFEDFSVGSHFKTIFKFNSEEQDYVKEFKEKMTKLVEQEDVLQLNVSEDIYDINTTFVVIHGLKSINGAKGFTALIDEGDNAIFERPFFAISSENYKTLQIHKNLDRYLEVYKN